MLVIMLYVRQSMENEIMLPIDVCYKESIKRKTTQNRARTQFYYILLYDKEVLCYNDAKLRNYRSAIYTFPQRKLISYSPPKMYHYQEWFTKEKLTYLSPDAYTVNEFIDGLMLTLFYDYRSSSWEIATKTNTNGDTIYYHDAPSECYNKKITEIFQEALLQSNNTLNWTILEQFSKSHSYTFIRSYSDSKLYLISVYAIQKESAQFVPPNEYEQWTSFSGMEDIICFPKRITYTTITNEDLIEELHNNKLDGIIVTNNVTGERCKLLTQWYTLRKHKRMVNEWELFYYLSLCKLKTIESETLQKEIKKYRKCVKLKNHLIDSLYYFYTQLYKEKNNVSLPDPWKILIEQIHQEVYIHRCIHHKKRFVSKQDLQQYLTQHHPSHYLHLMNV